MRPVCSGLVGGCGHVWPWDVALDRSVGTGQGNGEQEQRVAAKALPHLEPPANLGCAVPAASHRSQLVRARSMRLPR